MDDPEMESIFINIILAAVIIVAIPVLIYYLSQDFQRHKHVKQSQKRSGRPARIPKQTNKSKPISAAEIRELLSKETQLPANRLADAQPNQDSTEPNR